MPFAEVDNDRFDERSYTAHSHRHLLVFVLGVFSRKLDSVLALIGDNCTTNTATVELLGVPLFGCTAQKLNLAIKRYVDEQPGARAAIDIVSTMSSKTSNLKAAVALREPTDLAIVRNNSTRWPSTFRMLDCLFQIEDELRQVRDVEFPRHSALQVLRSLFPTLKKFDYVMVGLQDKNISVESARGTFDDLLEEYPELSQFLAQDSAIVDNPAFEAAVTKVQNNKASELTSVEERSSSNLKYRKSQKREGLTMVI
ncbi:unnamed protein product [Phytophthora fragariaefolia]|uniref:Unnamed protein product n=1 Tax=Phytophthora fragariaefolia TaxID=1490495 RepID=A0A9W7D277_9STRA|nr:unnamed protein product [Phytophthora fragariaefolia]